MAIDLLTKEMLYAFVSLMLDLAALVVVGLIFWVIISIASYIELVLMNCNWCVITICITTLLLLFIKYPDPLKRLRDKL